MRIVNVQTNTESFTLGGNPADLCGGCSIDVGSLSAVIRSSSYSDNATNIATVVLQPSSVAVTLETTNQHELEQGMLLGFAIAPILAIMWIIRRQFARGDSFD